MVEYALVIALLVTATVASIQYLEDETGKEVDNQANCISERPPPTSCQVPAAAPDPDPANPPGGVGDPSGGTPAAADATISDPPTVSLGPPVEATYTIHDDALPAPNPIVGEVASAQIVITESDNPVRVGEFHYTDCLIDETGTCTFTINVPGDVSKVTIRIVAVGVDTSYGFPEQTQHEIVLS